MSGILDYFDLQSEQRKQQKSARDLGLQTMVDTKSPGAPKAAQTPAFAPVWPQYIALVLGIVAGKKASDALD